MGQSDRSNSIRNRAESFQYSLFNHSQKLVDEDVAEADEA